MLGQVYITLFQVIAVRIDNDIVFHTLILQKTVLAIGAQLEVVVINGLLEVERVIRCCFLGSSALGNAILIVIVVIVVIVVIIIVVIAVIPRTIIVRNQLDIINARNG